MWKPKEADLTQSEAIEFAKRELELYWLGSPPLFAAIDDEGQCSLYPLSVEFANQTAVLWVVDPTTFWGQSILVYASEWQRRYALVGVAVIVVFVCHYEFLKSADTNREWFDGAFYQFIRVFDQNGLVAKAVNANEFPKLVVIASGVTQFEFVGRSWIDEGESEFQHFLRSNDPGLPLFPTFKRIEHLPEDCLRVEFGLESKLGQIATIGNGKFEKGPEGVLEGTFAISEDQALEPGHIYLSGKWNQDAEKLWTTDPEAYMRFKSPGNHVAVLAKPVPLPGKEGNPFLHVEVNQATPYDEIRGEELRVTEGSIMVYIPAPNFYRLLKNLPANERDVILKFPTANYAPPGIYGIRFGISTPKSKMEKVIE